MGQLDLNIFRKRRLRRSLGWELRKGGESGILSCMKTVARIMEPDAHVTLRLPFPLEWRKLTIRVKAELELVWFDGYPPEGAARQDLRGFGCLRGKIWIAPDFDERWRISRDTRREAGHRHACVVVVLRRESRSECQLACCDDRARMNFTSAMTPRGKCDQAGLRENQTNKAVRQSGIIGTFDREFSAIIGAFSVLRFMMLQITRRQSNFWQ